MKKYSFFPAFVIISILTSATTLYIRKDLNSYWNNVQDTTKKLIDGLYEGQSRSHYTGEPYWGKVRITIENGLYKNVSFVIRDSNLHETFTKKYKKHFKGNPEYIQQCLNDWKGVQTYPEKLMKIQDIHHLDAVTGATWSYNIFKASVEEALKNSVKNPATALYRENQSHSQNIAAAKLNESEFRDKVYACWLGKNIGGTLGMPFEGDTLAHDITFYTRLKEGEPAANDDLDLQILWLKAMQENNGHVDAFTLGRYWLKYVPVNWNEYGIGKANLKAGLMPPVSGEFNNSKWKHSNGAWIRSEIWACLFPGQPMMAAKFAREDACVDHGMAEGTLAEIFTASVESAAFFEHDRDNLIRFGLSMIPPDCRVSRAIRTAIRAKTEGKDWKQARLAVISDTKDMGWFQAPRNVAFTIIGWLYGEGDFGKSICIAINCGDDTDCTGATLASILGIIGGTKAIPENWRKPIGNKIVTVAINGFDAPATLDILTDSTVAMTRKVLAKYKLPVELVPVETDFVAGRKLIKPDKSALEKLWNLSPWRVARHNRDWVILFDYLGEPVVQENVLRKMAVSVFNVSGKTETYRLSFSAIPEGWVVNGLPADTFTIGRDGKKIFDLSVLPKVISSDTIRLNLMLKRNVDSDSVPVTLF